MRRRLRISVQAATALAVGVVVAGAGAAVLGWGRGTGAPRDDEPAAVPTCELGATVRGIDVSYHQPAIAWRRVRRAGIQFAFVRVSDGSTIADPKFGAHWAGARRAGLLRGAYQYFRPEESAIAQADLLIAALRRDRGELPPVIDVESHGGQPPAQVAARVRAWIERVRAQLGVEPIVYTGPEFWRDGVGGADLAAQPLWLAHYTLACPTVPARWARWTFWQHSDRGAIDGIDGPVDLNLFAGDYLALEELARRARLGAGLAGADEATGGGAATSDGDDGGDGDDGWPFAAPAAPAEAEAAR